MGGRVVGLWRKPGMSSLGARGDGARDSAQPVRFLTDVGGMAISGVRGEGTVFERRAAVPALPAAAQAPDGEGKGEGVFARAMRGLGREIDLGEARTARASQLHSYDTATLIALQVGIYRYTEAVDLASKIVDRATNAVRTVLQGGGH